MRFTIDRPEVASVEIQTFTDAQGIATARVDFISEGEATITVHVLRAPNNNPTQEKAVGILPPAVLGLERDSPLKQMAVGALKAGQTQKKAFSVKLPARSSVSGQFIIAVVDADDALEETNETNNPIVFGPLP